jgi:hypothetical protein
MNDCMEEATFSKWEDAPVSRASDKPRFRGKTMGSLSKYLSKYYKEAKILDEENTKLKWAFVMASPRMVGQMAAAYRLFHKGSDEVEDITMGMD